MYTVYALYWVADVEAMSSTYDAGQARAGERKGKSIKAHVGLAHSPIGSSPHRIVDAMVH